MCTGAFVSYKYICAIKEGHLPPELVNLKPGPIVYSRWLTTGEALLFLWTRQHGLVGNEAKNQKLLVKFCILSVLRRDEGYTVKYNHLPEGVPEGKA